MNLTVYLPDELGLRAKAEELNLSRLLRDAVSKEIERRDAMKATLEGSLEHRIRLEDKDGRTYIGRFTGKEIAYSGDCTVYVADDGRILVHNSFKLKKYEIEDPEEELRAHLEPAAYADAMEALGLDAVIDI